MIPTSTGEQERAKAALLELSQLSLDVQQNVLLVVHLHCPKFVILIDHLKLISIALYSVLIGSTFLFSFASAEQSGQYYVSTMRYFGLTTIHSNALRVTYIKPMYRRDTGSPPPCITNPQSGATFTSSTHCHKAICSPTLTF